VLSHRLYEHFGVTVMIGMTMGNYDAVKGKRIQIVLVGKQESSGPGINVYFDPRVQAEAPSLEMLRDNLITTATAPQKCEFDHRIANFYLRGGK